MSALRSCRHPILVCGVLKMFSLVLKRNVLLYMCIYNVGELVLFCRQNESREYIKTFFIPLSLSISCLCSSSIFIALLKSVRISCIVCLRVTVKMRGCWFNARPRVRYGVFKNDISLASVDFFNPCRLRKEIENGGEKWRSKKGKRNE